MFSNQMLVLEGVVRLNHLVNLASNHEKLQRLELLD